VRRAPAHPRRATHLFSGPSGTSAPHHSASPAHGPPQTSAGSAPRPTNTFVHKDLRDCTHAFLHQDATRRALEPPYSGPYHVLSRREKTLQLLVRGKPVTVSICRSGQASLRFGRIRPRSPTLNSPANTTPAPTPAATPPPPTATQTTRSGRHVRFPARLTT
jgi:hypothetical protein